MQKYTEKVKLVRELKLQKIVTQPKLLYDKTELDNIFSLKGLC